MTASVLVDTNVLVYAYDRSEPSKQQQALAVLDALALSSAGAVTSQILAEFFVTVTRKLRPPLSAGEAYGRLQNYLRAWTVYDVSGLIVASAIISWRIGMRRSGLRRDCIRSQRSSARTLMLAPRLKAYRW